ncbi:MAG: SLAC1 anion channel family protein [Betaproteobacteria bacterium]
MNNPIETHDKQRLEHFPVSIFSIVMGLSGLAIAWQKAHLVLGGPDLVWQSIAGLASALFVTLVVIYAIKILRYPNAVAAEWKHPVRVNFFPTISIGLLLLGIVWLETAPSLSRLLWASGTLIHLAFTFAILSSWMYHTHYDIKHANPAWFIPVVGNLFVPICGVHFAPPELAWFFFSIGMIFWIVLMTIVFYRIIFHEPIAARLQPTLFILLAPPAVGFIAYGSLVSELDGFGRVLYYTALFLTLLLGSNVLRFIRGGFFLSAWAYSFPLAAMTIASFAMAKRSGLDFFHGIAVVLLAIVSLVVVVLIAKTLSAVRRHAICVPE